MRGTMSGVGSVAKENCRTCLSSFSESNGKCSLMNCLAADSSRLELMKSVMTTCSVTLFSDKEDEGISQEISVCMTCVVEIDQMLDFLQKCIHSEAILKQASQVKTEITSEQSQSENRPPANVRIKEGFRQAEEVNGFHSEAPSPNTPNGPPTQNNKNPHSLTLNKFLHSPLKPHPSLIRRKNLQSLQLFNRPDRPHQCSRCPEAFPTNHRLTLHHLKAHCPKKYSCPACKRSFATVSSLKFHENIHLKQPHSCTACSKSFATASVLRQHKTTLHPDAKSFNCHCGRSFNRKKKLELHVESVHEKKDKSRRYSCPDCGKKFHHPYSLKNHLNTHLGVKPFLCSACGSAFSALSNLTSHLRRIHSADKPPAVKKYLCHTCGDSFARAAHLQRHTLRKHVPNAEKKHECPVCKKRFLEKSDVTGHVKLHDDVKPFVCEQCSKCFRTGWRLQAHVKRVHLGLRPFECPTCSLRFKTKSHLEKHIRTHTGEKPFPCPHCSYTCAEKSNLKKHINVHLKAM